MDANTTGLHTPNGLTGRKLEFDFSKLPLVGSASIDKEKGSSTSSRWGLRRTPSVLLISMGLQMKYTSSTGKPLTDGSLFNKP